MTDREADGSRAGHLAWRTSQSRLTVPRLTRTPNDKEQQGEDRVDDGEGGTSGDEALWLARLVGRRHKNKNNADTSEPTAPGATVPLRTRTSSPSPFGSSGAICLRAKG